MNWISFGKYWYILLVLTIDMMVLVPDSMAQVESRKFKELFPVGLKLSPSAFHLGAGASKLWGPFGGELSFGYEQGDSLYTSRAQANGQIGMVLEAGYTRFYKDNPVMDQLDITASFRQLKGSQSHVGQLTVERQDEELFSLDTEGEGYFDNSYAALSVDLSKHLQVNTTKYFFVGYGLNGAYKMFNTINYTPDRGLQRLENSNDFRAQAHLRFGYGFFYRKLIVMTASMELPIISNDGLLTTTWFNTTYVPSFLTLRITWLKRPTSMECPPVRPGRGENAKKKDYLQELFHPDSKRHPAPSRDNGSN